MVNLDILHIIYLITEITTLVVAIAILAYSKFSHKKINYQVFSFNLMLILMIALLTHIIFTHFHEQQMLTDTLNNVIKSKREISYITKTEKIFEELEPEITNSKNNVYIISWPSFGASNLGDKTLKFFEKISKNPSDKDDIEAIRLLWRKSHLEAIKNNVADYNKSKRLSLYYLQNQEQKYIIIPSVTIDHRIVHMGNGYLELNTEQVDYRIDNEEFARSFELYFTRLRDQGIEIKAANKDVDVAMIDKLLSEKN